MKKLSFIAVAFAAITIASCGGNKGAQSATEEADSLKSFEQEQIEAFIKQNIDSLASQIGSLKQLPLTEKDGVVALTEAEKQVKPTYLLDPALAETVMTLSEEYRVLSAMQVDRGIAKLYEMPLDEYDKAITKLAADINDPSFKVLDEQTDVYEGSEALYTAMDENGRINFFWQIVSAALVEQLYVISQNSDKFLAAFDDNAAANVTMRMILVQDAINRLTKYDPELVPVAEVLDPLTVINAVSVEELKAQIAEASDMIREARQALIQLEY